MKLDFEKAQDSVKYTHAILAVLQELHLQLNNVIQIKKQKSALENNNMNLSQAQDIANVIANFEKITSVFPEAITEMQQLCKQAQLLTEQPRFKSNQDTLGFAKPTNKKQVVKNKKNEDKT